MGYIGNQDYSIIEMRIGNVAGNDTEANILLKTPTMGELWISTDTGKLYLANGTSWTDIGTLQGDTGPQGEQGPQGVQGEVGNGISGISKTATVDDVDTYTIVMDDLTEYTFDVTNGTTMDVYSKLEIDTLVGDINSALDTINGEVI